MTSPMINEPLSYFRKWIPSRAEMFLALEAEADAEQIPIIGPVVGRLLYLLVRMHKPGTVIELGAATGYSSLFLAQACEFFGGRVVSFEIDHALAQRARINIANAGLSHLVEIRCENALVAMQEIQSPVDMIFMDIEKEDYIRALPHCARLLVSGGVLVADNTGFKDAHSFNEAIHADKGWEAVNLWSYLPGHSPEHDGICFALKV